MCIVWILYHIMIHLPEKVCICVYMCENVYMCLCVYACMCESGSMDVLFCSCMCIACLCIVCFLCDVFFFLYFFFFVSLPVYVFMSVVRFMIPHIPFTHTHIHMYVDIHDPTHIYCTYTRHTHTPHTCHIHMPHTRYAHTTFKIIFRSSGPCICMCVCMCGCMFGV